MSLVWVFESFGVEPRDKKNLLGEVSIAYLKLLHVVLDGRVEHSGYAI